MCSDESREGRPGVSSRHRGPAGLSSAVVSSSYFFISFTIITNKLKCLYSILQLCLVPVSICVSQIRDWDGDVCGFWRIRTSENPLHVVTAGGDLECVNELWCLMGFCSRQTSSHWPYREVEVYLCRLMGHKGQVALRVPLDQLVLGHRDFLSHHVLLFCHPCQCQVRLEHLR